MVAKVLAGLIVAIALVLATQAYGLGQTTMNSGWDVDATYLTGHTHYLSYYQTTCSGGSLNGQKVNKLNYTTSQWKHYPYWQGKYATFTTHRNSGQSGWTCGLSIYQEHRSSDQETFTYPGNVTFSYQGSDGYYYTSLASYFHWFPSTWHYLRAIPGSELKLGGSCLQTKLGSHTLLAELVPPAAGWSAPSCNW
jgi:hypothetical protein